MQKEQSKQKANCDGRKRWEQQGWENVAGRKRGLATDQELTAGRDSRSATKEAQRQTKQPHQLGCGGETGHPEGGANSSGFSNIFDDDGKNKISDFGDNNNTDVHDTIEFATAELEAAVHCQETHISNNRCS